VFDIISCDTYSKRMNKALITYPDIPVKLVYMGKANCRKGRHLSETQYYMERVASYEPIKIKKMR
jgi:hypothetical protein